MSFLIVIISFYDLKITIKFFLSISCTDDPYEIPEPDTTPPQALVIYPIDGEPVSGIITIEARANDNEKVTEVSFYINHLYYYQDKLISH